MIDAAAAMRRVAIAAGLATLPACLGEPIVDCAKGGLDLGPADKGTEQALDENCRLFVAVTLPVRPDRLWDRTMQIVPADAFDMVEFFDTVFIDGNEVVEYRMRAHLVGPARLTVHERSTGDIIISNADTAPMGEITSTWSATVDIGPRSLRCNCE